MFCKNIPPKTKLEEAHQLHRQVLINITQTETMESELPNFFGEFGFHFACCITLKVKLVFIHHFLPRLSAFVGLKVLFPLRATRYNAWQILFRNTKFWAEFRYSKYLITPRLVSPKYEPWLDQTRLICCRSVPKRYD